MSIAALAAIAVSCLVLAPFPEACVREYATPIKQEPAVPHKPQFTGEAIDVVLTAKAVLVWDAATSTILYERAAGERRPVASLSKLAAALIVRDSLSLPTLVEIPREAGEAQKRGANIHLPVGQHATVDDLLGASLTASANDAMVSLAVAMAGAELAFVSEVNRRLPSYGVYNTRLANSTGLEGGQQYSTAQDIRILVTLLASDSHLRSFLAAEKGVLTTQEGVRRAYQTTNKLLGTYVPVLAAKTGFTNEAGQNLALLTRTPEGREIGAVVLGSNDRFQDMKILVEWVHRNYTW